MTAATAFRTALVALAATVTALTLSRAAEPGPTAMQPELVYARDGEIYVRTAAGAVRRLTRNRVFDGTPSWSPDGRRIVFARALGNDSDLFVMNADGTDVKRLAGSARAAQDRYPRFSPDGRLIVFASNRGNRESDVFVMRADGTGVRRLTRGPAYVDDTQPSFSPDGRFVVFASNRLSFFNYEVYRMRAADGGGLTRLTFWGSGRDGAPGDDISPSYSPDGTRIAFVSDRPNGEYAIWTMDARGRGLREVSRHEGHDVVFPRYSPDGRRIVYTSFPDMVGVKPVERLWTVEPDGSRRTLLGLGGSADWLPRRGRGTATATSIRSSPSPRTGTCP